MSRKHNCPKRGRRNKSHYPERLTARGLTKAPQMESVEVLRARQERRKAQTGSLFPTIREVEEDVAA